MKWYCCSSTRKEKFCPECGDKAWEVEDEVAAASLTELLAERDRSQRSANTYKGKVENIKADMKKNNSLHIQEAEEYIERQGLTHLYTQSSDEDKVRMYLDMKLKSAESRYQGHQKRANKYSRWANSLYRHLFNTKKRI